MLTGVLCDEFPTGYIPLLAGSICCRLLHQMKCPLPMPTLQPGIEALDSHKRIDLGQFNHNVTFTVL
jgi:hypothetical protein